MIVVRSGTSILWTVPTTQEIQMEEHVIVDSSFSAVINAPLDRIDIPEWCFSLPDEEYQGCSPAHFAAGATMARDGWRMAINVQVIGGNAHRAALRRAGRRGA